MHMVVDVQCFKTGVKHLTVKELAVYDGTRFAHYVFKAPFPFRTLSHELQQQAQWLIHNHHCIGWYEGSTPAHLFPIIIQRLTKDATAVYVKGCEKANYLRQFISAPVIEVQEQPALPQMIPKCFYHQQPICNCALSNVYHIYACHVMDACS